MSKVKSICALSVHGYLDPRPILGATDTGGQVTYVLELSKALARLGVAVDIYTRRFGNRSADDTVAQDVRVLRVPCGGDEFIRKEDLLPHLDEYVANMISFVETNGLRYDLIHAHYWDAGYVGVKLADRMGIPLVFTAHSLGAWKKEQMGGDPDEMEKTFKFSQRIRWEKEIFRRASAQTVTTIDGKQAYKRLYGFESDRLVVISPGVDVRRFRPEPSQPPPRVKTPANYVFALSRIDSNKGLDFLIRAFDRLRDRCDASLVIGGGSKDPKPYEVEVKRGLGRLVESLGLSGRVAFTGYIPDDQLDSYYRNARVFVLPSKYEPFGMTVLEAMACGAPVVVTRHGGLSRVLTDRKDCLLVDPSEPEELSSAILEVLSNASLARRLRRAGLELVMKRFSWESIAEQTLSFYDNYAFVRGESF
jgi:mannosylfructose-phosphate synthase